MKDPNTSSINFLHPKCNIALPYGAIDHAFNLILYKESNDYF